VIGSESKTTTGLVVPSITRRCVEELLWQEYRQPHPDCGYGYSRFCDLYCAWRGQLDLVMRQERRAGEKLRRLRGPRHRDHRPGDGRGDRGPGLRRRPRRRRVGCRRV
jgi:hypothetical protein